MRPSSRRSSQSSGSSFPTSSRSSSADRAPSGAFDRELLARPTLEAARALLGACLVRDDADGRRTGRIVEVEAYIGTDDQASHARFGETTRNGVMFGPPGMAYVYLVYGMYDCLNVVTEPERRPAAILVRAIEPLEGIERMREARISRLSRRRGMTPEASDRERARLASIAPARLASGPGLVAAAFSIDRSDTGVDLCAARSGLHLEPATAGHRPFEIVAGPRVGIDYAGEPWASKPWRLAIAASAAVSGPTIPA